MMHFIYTYSENTPRNGHTVKTVSIYRIKRGQPVHLITRSDSFCDKSQLVLESLETVKGLPRWWFDKNQFGGHKLHLWQFKDRGIATFTEV